MLRHFINLNSVFYQFPTMEALRKGVFAYACAKGTAQILLYENEADFMKQTTLWIVHLAREEPHLFRLIYLSDYAENSKDMHGKMHPKALSQKRMEQFSLSESACQDIVRRGYLLLHGIATGIAVHRAEFSDEEVLAMTLQTTRDMVQGVGDRQKSLLTGAERTEK